MEPFYVAIGFYKNQRRYLAIDAHGRVFATENRALACECNKATAATLALCASVKFNLAHCRAVTVDESQTADAL